ncbi:unnamed protein product (macronuclear) [Paramecium tetraurelia]|uniref:Uncharacterized protein n=1 Tax=Paramecium tetraurelia TaxID=5888 RepID=A0C8H9_PARTE|nr:uncharacterized protein GSPATT00036229001 [Paramecium tetraurelia]CAK67096.1 unnamed protein product [Paramecium tetraurelia]|eukprot:XP_001434493.1 hypothetical protein (macronuclear) [Paramecium tetraurelia strain d4-2]
MVKAGAFGIGTPACVTLPCYLIDEVAACRTGGSLQTGGANTECDSLETFSLQYDNVCCDKNFGKMNYAFVRFTMNFDGFVDQTNDATPIPMASLNVATSVKEMFKLYTINPWIVSQETTEANFQSKLLAILNKYLETATRDVLLSQSRSHPFYLERTVYQSLQLLRDWTVIHRSTIALRNAILPKIWSLALVALTRMTTFQPNYYQTNYYFINFAIIPYFRNSLKISGQLHTLTIDWSAYSYTDKGYVMVYSYAPEQFGIIKAYTDVFCIRPFLGSTVAYSPTENNYDNLFASLKFTYYWSDTTLTITDSQVKLFKISDDTQTIVDTGVVFTCVPASRTCTNTGTYSPSPVPSDGKGQNYFIAHVNYDASQGDKKRAQCILAYKTWTTVCA